MDLVVWAFKMLANVLSCLTLIFRIILNSLPCVPIVKLLLSLLLWRLVRYFRRYEVLFASTLYAKEWIPPWGLLRNLNFLDMVPEWAPRFSTGVWSWNDMMLRDGLVTLRTCFEKCLISQQLNWENGRSSNRRQGSELMNMFNDPWCQSPEF